MSNVTHEWITTYTGKKFEPLHPSPYGVDIVDIAHALSQICRFGGHTKEFYSVAQHCFYVAELIDDWYVAKRRYWHKYVVVQALLHDASEAYLGDVVTPVKVTFNDYKKAEKILQETIFEGLGLPSPVQDGEVYRAIKFADERMFYTEYNQLFSGDKPCVRVGNELVPEADIEIECWTPEIAEINFLGMYHEYKPDKT